MVQCTSGYDGGRPGKVRLCTKSNCSNHTSASGANIDTIKALGWKIEYGLPNEGTKLLSVVVFDEVVEFEAMVELSLFINIEGAAATLATDTAKDAIIETFILD